MLEAIGTGPLEAFGLTEFERFEGAVEIGEPFGLRRGGFREIDFRGARRGAGGESERAVGGERSIQPEGCGGNDLAQIVLFGRAFEGLMPDADAVLSFALTINDLLSAVRMARIVLRSSAVVTLRPSPPANGATWISLTFFELPSRGYQ